MIKKERKEMKMGKNWIPHSVEVILDNYIYIGHEFHEDISNKYLIFYVFRLLR